LGCSILGILILTSPHLRAQDPSLPTVSKTQSSGLPISLHAAPARRLHSTPLGSGSGSKLSCDSAGTGSQPYPHHGVLVITSWCIIASCDMITLIAVLYCTVSLFPSLPTRLDCGWQIWVWIDGSFVTIWKAGKGTTTSSRGILDPSWRKASQFTVSVLESAVPKDNVTRMSEESHWIRIIGCGVRPYSIFHPFATLGSSTRHSEIEVLRT
jgi:hypothetical protein